MRGGQTIALLAFNWPTLPPLLLAPWQDEERFVIEAAAVAAAFDDELMLLLALVDEKSRARAGVVVEGCVEVLILVVGSKRLFLILSVGFRVMSNLMFEF